MNYDLLSLCMRAVGGIVFINNLYLYIGLFINMWIGLSMDAVYASWKRAEVQEAGSTCIYSIMSQALQFRS